MESQSALIRLQTFYILINNGSKIKKPEQLWKLKSDVVQAAIFPKPGTEEYKEWFETLRKKHKLK